MLDIPDPVRRKALLAGAGDWLESLPALIASLEREWGIDVGRPYRGGTEAYVAEATLADGTLAVLKLLVPRDGDAARNEITALRLANGEGCVRLLRSDDDRGALLLERLGRSLSELGLPVQERLEILCAAAIRIWRPVPRSGLPTGADKARSLQASIVDLWEQLARPCSERAVEYALGCADRRAAAHRDERAVLVHGDVHQWNALEADGGGFKLVDPDGLFAEVEYDLGILMREDPVELLGGRPVQPRCLACTAHRVRCRCDLGVGRCRASLDGAAVHQRRPAAGGTPDAGSSGLCGRAASPSRMLAATRATLPRVRWLPLDFVE